MVSSLSLLVMPSLTATANRILSVRRNVCSSGSLRMISSPSARFTLRHAHAHGTDRCSVEAGAQGRVGSWCGCTPVRRDPALLPFPFQRICRPGVRTHASSRQQGGLQQQPMSLSTSHTRQLTQRARCFFSAFHAPPTKSMREQSRAQCTFGGATVW